ncbi:heptosyltransferase-3 [Chromohalobacter marismortui]|uniref:Heptosyltransferase-3 n=1 Tax=Chromohalobacter marismortui TaxID=42055 RepID=A0A4R7NWQ1_9GAMM|nr:MULTISPECIES: glycosyltransferase family 9 protein [Chromohalobacter]MCI0511204.1 glycosyltransferase family 9 protein [Chromohalobacter sp.]MCI0593940.1 glycosyltransferase family 9 protein [Chromohalobacter sp.]TDU25229.1 heptosyltransferase-3 [Chromohalobacter marismortui]
MFPLTYLRRHTAMRRLGRRLEKTAKRWIYRAVARGSRPARPATSEALHGVRRVLLIRPNFRIGNAVIGARLIQAFVEGRADIEVDYLGTDTTRTLFAGMPLSRYHALSRSMLVRPWRLARLLVRLRRRQFDLAIQAGENSLTSWLLMKTCGARQRLGQRGRLETSYDWVCHVSPSHAHERASSLAASLGLACAARPWLVVSEHERRAAAVRMTGLSGRQASIGIFVGGHLDKRLPLEFWQDLLRELERRKTPYLVLLGPEESAMRTPLESGCGEFGRVLPHMPLRDFLGVLANLECLITPDTGPMHMAAALDVPVLALLQVEKSRKFSPRGPSDSILFQPTPSEVAEQVCTNAVFHDQQRDKASYLAV